MKDLVSLHILQTIMFYVVNFFEFSSEKQNLRQHRNKIRLLLSNIKLKLCQI